MLTVQSFELHAELPHLISFRQVAQQDADFFLSRHAAKVHPEKSSTREIYNGSSAVPAERCAIVGHLMNFGINIHYETRLQPFCPGYIVAYHAVEHFRGNAPVEVRVADGVYSRVGFNSS
jgi:hypothetical protein